MARRRLTAYRQKLNNPAATPDTVDWLLRHDSRMVIYQIKVFGVVDTPHGEMSEVSLQQRAELANPDADVAVLIGQVVTLRRSGIQDPSAPELWFYNDKFWLKARGGGDAEYYNAQKYLFYEVVVNNVDGLMAVIKTGLE